MMDSAGITSSALGWVIARDASHAALQTAADEAHANGQRLYAAGVCTTDQTLTIRSDADLSGLAILYTGTGSAVHVGMGQAGERVIRKTIHLPHVQCLTKPSKGWVAGTVGVKLDTLSGCFVRVPMIRDFDRNLVEEGNGHEHAYNQIHIGSLLNGRINQALATGVGGWTNENNYYGGRWAHFTNEGRPAPGTRHIYLSGVGTSRPNNNRWWGPSLESPGVVEHHIDVEVGANNRWVHGRFEHTGGLPTVRWGPLAVLNEIDGGMQADDIIPVHEPGSWGNSISGAKYDRRALIGPHGNVWENGTRTSAPVLTVTRPGGMAAGDNPSTQYLLNISGLGVNGKRNTDTSDRAVIDSHNGRILLGDGASAPIEVIRHQSGELRLTGSTVRYLNSGNLPTPSEAMRGQVRFVHGASDGLHVCVRTEAGAYQWKQLA